MKYCPNCGSLGAGNDLVCGHCGTRLTENMEQAYIPTEPTIPSAPPVPEKKTKGSKKKVLIPIIAGVAVLGTAAALILTHVICLKHDWQDATCTKPKMCSYCDKSEGEALGHDFAEATCTTPQTCTLCGQEQGELKEHTWQEATCTAPKTCSVCGREEGETAGHDWQDATCTEPKTCAACDLTEGDAMGHKAGEWTETEKPTLVKDGLEEQICTVCDEVLDSRETDAKKPAAELLSFNFTDEEFIEWANKKGADLASEELSDGRLGKDNTVYMLSTDKGIVLLAMNHGDNGLTGNICAIVATVETEDEIANAYTALAVFGNMIDPSFSLKGADDAFIEGRSYIKAGMVLARVENNVVLTPIGYLAKVVLQ